MRKADLAPGDGRSIGPDWSKLSLHRIHSLNHPLFPLAYRKLCEEFGPKDEIEAPSVLQARMRWKPSCLIDGCAFKYRMFLVRRKREFVAVRDHTAIVRPESGACLVHLSHALVGPKWRRSGISGWLRALPVRTARTCIAAAKLPADTPITLAGEMEPQSLSDPSRIIRLKAYEKAGYKKIDLTAFPYFQPDFRDPKTIDATGGPSPVPFSLIIRRIGREAEDHISSAEARWIVETLYKMYAVEFRPQDMQPMFERLDLFPKRAKRVNLVPPTSLP